jgi:hypothetical protein
MNGILIDKGAHFAFGEYPFETNTGLRTNVGLHPCVPFAKGSGCIIVEYTGEQPTLEKYANDRIEDLRFFIAADRKEQKKMVTSYKGGTIKSFSRDVTQMDKGENLGNETDHVTYKLRWSDLSVPDQPSEVDVWVRYSICRYDPPNSFRIQSYMTCRECRRVVKRHCEGGCGYSETRELREGDSY